MKVRPAMSMMSLEESMQQCVEITDRAHLIRYLQERFDFWSPSEENVTVTPYCYDERIGWNTHIICIDGLAALFSDGLPDSANQSE